MYLFVQHFLSCTVGVMAMKIIYKILYKFPNFLLLMGSLKSVGYMKQQMLWYIIRKIISTNIHTNYQTKYEVY